MHGGNETGPDTLVLAIEMGQEVFLVVEQTAQQHAVVSVHGLAEETDQESEPQKDGSRVGPRDRFLKHGSIVSFATVDFLDLDDLFQGLVMDGMAYRRTCLTFLAASMESMRSMVAAPTFSSVDILTMLE